MSRATDAIRKFLEVLACDLPGPFVSDALDALTEAEYEIESQREEIAALSERLADKDDA